MWQLCTIDLLHTHSARDTIIIKELPPAVVERPRDREIQIIKNGYILARKRVDYNNRKFISKLTCFLCDDNCLEVCKNHWIFADIWEKLLITDVRFQTHYFDESFFVKAAFHFLYVVYSFFMCETNWIHVAQFSMAHANLNDTITSLQPFFSFPQIKWKGIFCTVCVGGKF